MMMRALLQQAVPLPGVARTASTVFDLSVPVAADRRARPRPRARDRCDGPHARRGFAAGQRGPPASGRPVEPLARGRDARGRDVLRVAGVDGAARPDRCRRIPLGLRHHLPRRDVRDDRAIDRLQPTRAHSCSAEVHVLVLFATVGMMLLAAARDLDDRLPRHRADVDRRVRAGGTQPAQRAVGRGCAQVLPARGVLDRVSAVRHGADLRRDRLHESGRRSASGSARTRWAGRRS